MDISRYVAFFHDGSIINIDHMNNCIKLTLQSAEIGKSDLPQNMSISENNVILPDNVQLSKQNYIVGILHIENVKCIKINNVIYSDTLIMHYDDADILDFEIKNNSVELSITWVNYPPKPQIDEFATILIEARNIYWENIPNFLN